MKKHTYFGIDATTTSKDWGFAPVPGKGGKTTNYEITADIFKRELAQYEGGTLDA